MLTDPLLVLRLTDDTPAARIRPEISAPEALLTDFHILGAVARPAARRLQRGGGLRLRVDVFDARVVASLNAERPAAAAVARDVTTLISFRPLAIGAGDLLPRRKYWCPMLVAIDMAFALHRAVNYLVEILA